eukprot:8714765-Alexandrium_andersonii.AAC.1
MWTGRPRAKASNAAANSARAADKQGPRSGASWVRPAGRGAVQASPASRSLGPSVSRSRPTK